MESIWAPWRETYITNIHKKKTAGCIFCRIQKSKDDRGNFVFARNPLAFAVLNIYPYSNGHCLILPNRHANDLSKLSPDEIAAMMELLLAAKAMLQKGMKPHGFNVGINLGRLAGAGIPGHVHIHIVPRWKGDHNFMPITGKTRVLSQSLQAIYKLLTPAPKKK